MSAYTRLRDSFRRVGQPFRQAGTAADRLHERFDCYIMSTLSVVDRALVIDGIVDSLSRGGIQFRPASTHLLNRRGERVLVAVGHRSLSGTIVGARPSGYGIALHKPLTPNELTEILREFE